MRRALEWVRTGLSGRSVEHAARTTVAAIVSLLAARALKMPESYWSAISTLVVMQSTLGAALTASMRRLAGTALGATAGALLAGRLGANVILFGAGLFGLGLVCALLHLDRSAFRFAGITLAIVMLIAGRAAPSAIAVHRFVEVAAGIVVALIVVAVWPEREPRLRGQERALSGS